MAVHSKQSQIHFQTEPYTDRYVITEPRQQEMKDSLQKRMVMEILVLEQNSFLFIRRLLMLMEVATLFPGRIV